jgi:hypothetical protein
LQQYLDTLWAKMPWNWKIKEALEAAI